MISIFLEINIRNNSCYIAQKILRKEVTAVTAEEGWDDRRSCNGKQKKKTETVLCYRRKQGKCIVYFKKILIEFCLNIFLDVGGGQKGPSC